MSDRKLNKDRQKNYILNIVKDWAGGEAQALDWYENTHIKALGYTAKEVVEKGNFEAVVTYLEVINLGGYA